MSNWMQELRDLKALADDGLLTDDEFAAEKARLMASRSLAAPAPQARDHHPPNSGGHGFEKRSEEAKVTPTQSARLGTERPQQLNASEQKNSHHVQAEIEQLMAEASVIVKTRPDCEDALPLWENAAGLGSAQAMECLANHYYYNGTLNGNGEYDCVPRMEKVLPPLRRAAELGEPRAQWLLGTLLFNGRDLHGTLLEEYGKPLQDEAEGLRLIRAALDGNVGFSTDPVVENLMARASEYSDDAEPGQAIPLWETAARMGNADAMHELANQYYDGELVGENGGPEVGKVIYYLRGAAEEGHSEAQYFLGWLLCSGRYGFPEDKSEGMRWIGEAQRQGHPKAMEFAKNR